jgi:tRNA dimethylallyltransferase
MRAGMVAEVRTLLQRGVPTQRLLNLGLEYRYVTRFLQHKLTRKEMLEQLETAIFQYAKRQRTWFRRNANIHWVTSTPRAVLLTEKFLRS